MKNNFGWSKNLSLVAMLFAIVVVLFWNTGYVVNAAEPSQEIKHFTDVYITAFVPEGYDADVIVYFKNEDNEESILLRADEGYTKKRMMFEGTYQTWAERKNSTDFACEIQETCVVSGTEMDFTFTVLSTHQEVSESEAQAILESNAEPVSADVSNMESGEEIFQWFLDATDYIKENEGFLLYESTLNESEVHKERFLENVGGSTNTEEDWDAMSDYDVRVYMDTFYNPFNTLTYVEVNTEEDFIKQATSIDFYRKIEGGEGYADALEKLIRWQWQYYEQTGTLYNFFAEEGNENAHFNQVETDKNGLTEKESKELEEAREELLEGEDIEELLGEEKDELPIVKFVKENVVSVIILIVALLGVVGMTIYIKNKKNGAE